jgi:hypothetical protein
MNINEIDLRPKWLEMILRILAVHLSEAEVLAYGSRVSSGASRFMSQRIGKLNMLGS